jgi:hypothetical protein
MRYSGQPDRTELTKSVASNSRREVMSREKLLMTQTA